VPGVVRGRWLAVAVGGAVVVAVVVAGVVAAAVHRDSTPSAPASAAADCRWTTAQVRAPAATEVAGTGERVAVLGDSWTSGYGLADPREGWAYVLARGLGWHAAVDGFPGTGFTSDAGCPGERYADRVVRIPADAALVLVEGGLNDVRSASAVRTAAGALLEQVHARAPGAALVVVGAPAVPGRVPAQVRAVDRGLAAAAAAHGAAYLDPAGWTLTYLPDGVHPTAAGHRAFADRVAAGLAARGLTP
jgi:acyl-CoA thioesterase-1